ncbi:PucR family transcriptional regulator [[Mycobacterium] kokjensenii]|uniref:PucR family transcriptional regulator n=1 Tax=[Mycobacterium] kokjensenii TaxID=3064287 RepID=A0ABM9LAB5_9MYCO|nr:PucR family transcriptional regulator [Mycolicibacter sp. MU0083]CAJ1495657.1 PucR family transcriptional regulator [Mycolicibacter sp. MU0083]
MDWPPPSAPVQELIRQTAQIAVAARPEWLEELDRATLASHPALAADPVLAAAISRSNRANLIHWAAANMLSPGAAVEPNLGPEPLGIARDLVRRGLDAAALDAYRVGQGVAWRRLMEIAFELCSDPAQLHELLDVCSRSISAFIDATLAGIAAQIDLERDELTRSSHAERLEVVTLLLDGAPISPQRAENRLGYSLGRTHTAAIVWTDRGSGDVTGLDRAVAAFGRAAGSASPLSIPASSASRWVWVPGTAAVDSDGLTEDMSDLPDVRIAIGFPATGIEGFRHSHFDALATQRTLARLQSPQRIVFFTDIALTALITQDRERADEFVARTLGDFASAGTEMHRTVSAFVSEQCNVSRAAARLYAHRNTLLRRLTRADRLLPRPLAENYVEVAVALNVLRWSGGAAVSAPAPPPPPQSPQPM